MADGNEQGIAMFAMVMTQIAEAFALVMTVFGELDIVPGTVAFFQGEPGHFETHIPGQAIQYRRGQIDQIRTAVPDKQETTATIAGDPKKPGSLDTPPLADTPQSLYAIHDSLVSPR